MQVRLNERLAGQVAALALAEQRSVTQMVALLLKEALSRRPPIGSEDAQEAREAVKRATKQVAPTLADAQPRDIPARTIVPGKRSYTPDLKPRK